MITEIILNFIMLIFSPVIKMLPDLSFSAALNAKGVNVFMDWVSLAGYMFPFETVLRIFGIIVALQIFRIVVAFFKSLWGVLPMV